MMQEITLQGQQLYLLPERAIWWPAQRAIILSDVHWGKSAHFRKHGIPMPGSTQQHDAVRLAGIVRRHHAEHLIIAGDLFHSKHNSEVDDFVLWRNAHTNLRIHFVMGNHDILSPHFYHSLNFEVHREGLAIGPFYIAHDDTSHEGLYTIHGHVHPGLSMRGLGVHAVTLPCFCIGDHAMILPAFGKFTGCKRIEPAHFRSVYLIGEEKVMRLK
jgi:DNA ligase-associated metallophosphoesterase